MVRKIKLVNFRNYKKVNINFDKKINILIGDNAQGKTNILESIYVLAFTKSHRSFIDHSLIKDGQDSAIIKGILQKEISYNLEIILNKTKKRVKIDNDSVTKLGSYIEKMNIIIFYSDDLSLIKGYPSNRRKYLNLEISQISQTYYNTLNDYNRLLKIRNDYLKRKKSIKNIDMDYFNVLNEYIVEKSIFIYQMRNQYIQKLNEICPKIYKDITGLSNFKIKYLSSIDLEEDKTKLKLELKNQLTNNLEKELKLQTTLYGPHKDDFEFHLKEENLRFYGSQGQQRIAVLTIKLAEIEIIKNYKNEFPIVLLDDVFSELDNEKKNNLLSYINKDMQVIITTTDLENIDKQIINKAKLIHIKQGKMQKEVKK